MNFRKYEALHCSKYSEILRRILKLQTYRLVFKFHMLFSLPKYLTSAFLYSGKRSENPTVQCGMYISIQFGY